MKASELAKVLPDCEVLAIRDGMTVRILNNSVVKEIKHETYDPREQRNSNPTYSEVNMNGPFC